MNQYERMMAKLKIIEIRANLVGILQKISPTKESQSECLNTITSLMVIMTKMNESIDDEFRHEL